MYLDTQDYPQKLPPALEPILCLDEETRLPSIQSLKDDIDHAVQEKEPESLVLGGEGEPTMRWSCLLSLARMYSHLNVRVTTNGLIPSTYAVQMKDNGIQTVSVALMTADPTQYIQLMKPADSSLQVHYIVCEFIQQAVRCNLQVEVTGVDRSDVDKEATEKLVMSLGVQNAVRWRPYFS
jgi:molybdenum cofactor biosynthesis enzyme MoaA